MRYKININIKKNKDFVASLRNQYNESKETVAKAVQEWKPTIEKLTDLKEVEYDLEGYKVKAQVSAETRTQLQKEITNIIASNPSLPLLHDRQFVFFLPRRTSLFTSCNSTTDLCTFDIIF